MSTARGRTLKSDDQFAIHNLLARFANSFDLKQWEALADCLCAEIYTDYSGLRGTPPEMMSNTRFAELRRSALQQLQTPHLAGSIELLDEAGTMEVASGGSAAYEVKSRVGMQISRRDADGRVLNTRCIYQFGLRREASGWKIATIVQTLLWNEGDTGIHAGIVQPAAR
jgi:hypothetical protein